MLIDSHCHLDYFSETELPDVLSRARGAGVDEMVTISTRLSQEPAVKALAAQDGVWCTVGVHPHNAGEAAPEAPEAIAALADHPRVVGIGEAGLDYFYDKAPHDTQAAWFRAQIRAARLADLPLVIHARDADEDVEAILREEHAAGGPFAFVLHCFSSGRGLCEAGLSLGGYVSFSGMITFAKSETLREIARDVPEDRLLVETDAPYLAPVPFRGKRNEPAHVAHTAARLAAVRGIGLEALGALTTMNFRRLFTRAR